MSSTHLALATAADRYVASALLVAEDGRYLLQRRDPDPTIHLPDHWGLFGGGIEPGEEPEAALRREVEEELTYVPRQVGLFTEAVHWLPFAKPIISHMLFFEVAIFTEDVPGMIQTEGAGMALLGLPEILQLDRVAPWDLAAIVLHARQRAILASA
jgi:8-oxo-dGTP pyrophosphatase MutT (NUDIX family)